MKALLILLAIFMNLLGILICFLTKFRNRKGKDKAFSINFWIADNWPELLIIVLFDFAMMILFMAGDIKVDVSKFLPEWVIGMGNLTISFLLGLGLSALIYEIFKKKVKQGNKD